MVEVVRAGDSAHLHLCVTARPNSAAGKSGRQVAMSILVPSCILVGVAFLMLGAWPATLFMALPLIGLTLAFHQVELHAGDFERLTLDGDRLILDRHLLDQDQHLEFNSYWVQVALRHTSVGSNTLALRSHGKEVFFGQLMSDEEREALGLELKRDLAQIRR